MDVDGGVHAHVSTVRALFLGIYSLYNVYIAPSVSALFLLLLATAKNRLHSEEGRSHSLKLDQAKHRPSRRSPRPILRVGNWGVGSKAVSTFHEEGEVQVLSPGTCNSACPCPALPYLGPKLFTSGRAPCSLPRAVLYSHSMPTRSHTHAHPSRTFCYSPLPDKGQIVAIQPFLNHGCL